MENIYEKFLFVAESFKTYSGSNPVWLLYPIALVLIWFLGKKEDRKLFLGVLLTECLTIFNPFIADILVDTIGFGNRYRRFFWMLVFFITIAYALTLVVLSLKKVWLRAAAVLVSAVLIAGLGIPVFVGADVPSYTASQNEYFIDQEILDLSNIIHSEGIEKPRILSDGLLLVYRQYDPDVRSYVSRRVLQRIEKKTEEKFMKSKKVKSWVKQIVQVYFYHNYTLPAEEFQKLVSATGINYIISTSVELDQYLEKTEMYVLGQTGNCRVWKVI